MNTRDTPAATYGSVLILDSDREQARELSRHLTRQNWTAVLSFSETMALKSLKHSRFQLFMVDGYVDGVEMIERLALLKQCARNMTRTFEVSDCIYWAGFWRRKNM